MDNNLFANEIDFDVLKPEINIPDDDLTPPAAPADTIFYLTISTPHTDAFEWHGPYATFAQIPPIVCAHAPSTDKKLEKVGKHGFTKIVVVENEQQGKFTVFESVTKINQDVRSMLPNPVFTVTSAGPILHKICSFTGKLEAEGAKGWSTKALSSRIVGTYIDRKEARRAADQTMRDLLASEDDPPQPMSSFPAMNAGGGLIMVRLTFLAMRRDAPS
ncbi:rRNA-processing protein EBP2 [Paraconiothyrium brasiliense]|uniref:rRNA-processing protein EBP2 n=1 Tax=Paraconiothyrium brasiliense TaxID=300254 RepID=A0ABR3RPH2_9PLEO